MCVDRIHRKVPETALKCCNQALKAFNPLSLLANRADIASAIFAPSMRPLCVAYLYRQYIASSVKYIASSRSRENQPADRSSGLDVGRLDPLHAGVGHLLPGGCQRAVEIDRPGGVLDHVGREAELAGVYCGPGDAEVGRQPDQEHRVDT